MAYFSLGVIIVILELWWVDPGVVWHGLGAKVSCLGGLVAYDYRFGVSLNKF